MTTAECIQFWALIVTATGVLAALSFSLWQAFLSRKQLKVIHQQTELMQQQMEVNHQQVELMRQQMKVDLFADYTKRYQEIILNFPENINENNFDLDELKNSKKDDDVKTYNKTMRYMRVYFDLCSEEFFLNQNKKIEKEDWIEWSKGIKYTFTKTAFRDAWEIATTNSKFYKEFADWINDEVLQLENNK